MTERKATPSNGRRSRGKASHGGRRRKAAARRGVGPLVGGLAVVAVLGVTGVGIVSWTSGGEGDRGELSAGAESRTSAGGGAEDSAEPSPEDSRPAPDDDGTPSSSPSASLDKTPSRSPSASADPPRPTTFPENGPGTFTVASGTSDKVGKGKKLRRYRVEIEDGLSLSTSAVAEEVEAVLKDPRGWTADGESAFQRVSDGATDFVVKVATAGTVDDICGDYGLDTGGEYNCSVGGNVMVNIKRWELATRFYADDVKGYRALIINHEVGHFLEHGHVTCPGKGRPAPAMMQQIKGLKGCVPNVWPYDADGRLITGPSVP
ncbi:DUF3152 domain-containing protein [Streptomyces sp. NPDC002643]